MSVVLHTPRATVIRGDCLETLRKLPDNRVDAVVTDPPYGLSFMGKAWDYDVPKAETWREVLRVLKPGGHLLSFFGSRTFHRGVCQIEDAGFEIRDSLMWLYGTGFPKSLTSKSAEIPEWAGTALKPAHEPIVLARKPLTGTVAANVQAHGTGALNIDRCRIETSAADAEAMQRCNTPGSGRFNASRAEPGAMGRSNASGELDTKAGRWPANVLLDEEAAAALDAQSGTLKSGAWNGKRNEPKTKNTFGAFALANEAPKAGDSGGASRFFYVAKASRAERDAGCEHLAAKSGGEATDREDGSIGVDNPRAGAGRTGGAKNFHPTVKPVALMRWLVRLITPPGGLVLDPFTGSGTTGVAALKEGFDFLGCERDPGYCEIIKARIRSATI